MRFARIFIARPVLAMVISIVITIAGGVSIFLLPISQYPNITPPTVQVTANYAGASASVMEQSVAIPIEQSVNGAENLLYLSSRSTNTGNYSLTCTFAVGTDVNVAAMDVQNRVQQAQGLLPAEVITTGITVRKRSPSLLMIVSIYSPDASYDSLFLSNYASIYVLDPLSRVRGVGDTFQIGQQYSMRVWLQPDKMAALGVTATDVATSIRQQNVQAPAGQIGSPPAPPGTAYQYSVQAQGQLTRPKEYDNIIVRNLPDGSILRIGDIGHTELGGLSYATFSRLNGLPASSIILYQLPTANALQTADSVIEEMDRLQKTFPPGVRYRVTMNSTAFVVESVHEVIKTLLEAIGLVLIVVFVFLGSPRATMIPMLAVPVSLVGTFSVFLMLGFSINTLTLFGLVLAIGLVVDDAIVVVEAVERHIEEGLDPRRATERAMDEVGGALIAIALVLSSVFLPVAFLGGITGQLYRQFAVTLAVSIILSAFVALTLTPALCALLLKHRDEKSRGILVRAIGGFNRFFDRVTAGYTRLAHGFVRAWPVALLGVGGIVAVIFLLIAQLPTGFVPSEDQGYFFINVTLPDGASLERTDAVMRRAETLVGRVPGVANATTIGGLSLLTGGQQSNNGTIVVALQPWDDRDAVTAIIGRAQAALSVIPEAIVIPFNPPPIPGLGNAGGLQFELEDRSGGAIQTLNSAALRFSEASARRPELTNIFNSFRTNVPQVGVQLDRDKASTLGIPTGTIFDSMQTLLGGLLLNNFNRFGRVYRVMLQAEPAYRNTPADIQQIFVRTSTNQMVPLSSLLSVHMTSGPDIVQRFNLFRSAEITAAAAPGYSSGQALAAMEQVARTMPPEMGFDWAGVAYQERASSGGSGPIFALSFIFVFLFLAAQYESWVVPLAVLLGVPLGVLGAFLGIWMHGLINDVYVQIGVVMLIGLTAKNGILIVEFAKGRRESGTPLREAALEAARLRFRPIVMTSLAFIFGMLPLVIATGAGSGSRHSLGTAVFAGMISATVLEVFFVPAFFVAVEGLVERFRRAPHPSPVPPEPV